jgi:magnesium chelatase family protein
MSSNSEMSSKDVKLICTLDSEGEGILSQAVKSMDLSARAYYRILKLSRSIADLEGSESIKTQHILESLSYRKKEEN